MDKYNSMNCTTRAIERYHKPKCNIQGNPNYKINSFEAIINSQKKDESNKNKRAQTIKSLLFDDSLANNFSFVSSSLYNMNLNSVNLSGKRNNNIIYSQVFNQDDYDIKYSSIYSIVDSNNCFIKDTDINKNDLAQLSSNNIKLNFGDEDPHITYRNIIMKFNEGFMTSSLKEEISNYLNNLSHFHIFRYNLEYNNHNSYYVHFTENNENYTNSFIYSNTNYNIVNKKTKIFYPVRYENITSIIINNNKLIAQKRERNIIKSSIVGKNKINNNIVKTKIKNKRYRKKKDKSKSIICVKDNKFIINLEETDSEL